jgi:hypothetical protein
MSLLNADPREINFALLNYRLKEVTVLSPKQFE